MDVEKEHVHKVYSEIAAHFSDTRFKPWPRIAQFLGKQPPGSLIADVGCGNGKYLAVNPEVFMVGSDICPELVSIGRSRSHEVMISDCLHLPYRSSVFDALICIAVIHHLSSEQRRLKALVEMARVLRPGGNMLVYVWAMEQQRKKFDSQDVMVPWHLQPKYIPGGVKMSTKTGSKEAKAVKARAKKQEKRERKSRDREGRCEGRCEGHVGSDSSRKDEGHTLELCERDFPGEDKQIPGGEEQHVTACPANVRERSEHAAGKVGQEERAAGLGELGYATYQRYYHVFREGELLQLFSKVPTLKVDEEFYDHENWCILAMKN